MRTFEKIYSEFQVAERAGLLTITSSRRESPGMYAMVVFKNVRPETVELVRKRIVTLAPAAEVHITPGFSGERITLRLEMN